jgi:low affinity Fe/Cu permease
MGDAISPAPQDPIKEFENRVKSLEDTKAKLTFIAWALGVLGLTVVLLLVYLQNKVGDLYDRTSKIDKVLNSVDEKANEAIAEIESKRLKAVDELKQEVVPIAQGAVPKLEQEIKDVRERTEFIYSSARKNGGGKLTHRIDLTNWDSSGNKAALDATERWMYEIIGK